jgi:putative transposase
MHGSSIITVVATAGRYPPSLVLGAVADLLRSRSEFGAWTGQQLREATPYGQVPQFLIRDNDGKFGPDFARVAAISGIRVLRTPPHAPRANAVCERFLGSVRRACLDHGLLLSERHLRRVLGEYVRSFKHGRPHQGLGQHVPHAPTPAGVSPRGDGPVVAGPILGGLHHEYRRAA